MSGDDDQTNTSSPGWHSKLSALNFLHLQVRIYFNLIINAFLRNQNILHLDS